MSKLTEQLKTAGIFNPHDFAGHGHVYISYSPASRIGLYRGPRWSVVRPGFKTDPEAHWMDNGCMTFSVWRRSMKQPRLDEAKAWAAKRYSITEWAKTPFGTWMDAEFVKRRLKELKAALKEKANA